VLAGLGTGPTGEAGSAGPPEGTPKYAFGSARGVPATRTAPRLRRRTSMWAAPPQSRASSAGSVSCRRPIRRLHRRAAAGGRGRASSACRPGRREPGPARRPSSARAPGTRPRCRRRRSRRRGATRACSPHGGAGGGAPCFDGQRAAAEPKGAPMERRAWAMSSQSRQWTDSQGASIPRRVRSRSRSTSPSTAARPWQWRSRPRAQASRVARSTRSVLICWMERIGSACYTARELRTMPRLSASHR